MLSSEESFAKRWPEFFRDVRSGYAIPKCWKSLLWHLCAAIEWELRKDGRPLTDFTIHQIKCKFGGLRFYCSVRGDENELDRTIRAVYSLVEMAQEKSWKLAKEAHTDEQK